MIKDYIREHTLQEMNYLKLDKRRKLLLVIELIAFVSAIAIFSTGLVVYRSHFVQFLCIAVCSFIVYIFCYIYDYKIELKAKMAKLKMEFCENEIKYLDGDFSPFCDGQEYVNPLHLYAYDMDVFGNQSLFHRIDRTKTRKGECLLAALLIKLSKNDVEIRQRQEAVKELSPKFAWRMEYLSIDASKKLDMSSCGVFLKKPFALQKWQLNRSCLFVINIIVIASLISGFINPIFAYIFACSFILNNLYALIVCHDMNKVQDSLSNLVKDMKGFMQILSLIKDLDTKSKILCECKSILFNNDASPNLMCKSIKRICNRIDQRTNIFFLLISNGLFLYDLYTVMRIKKLQCMYIDKIQFWEEQLGKIDVFVSLSNYAYNSSNVCFPEINLESEYIFKATELYHPFLRYEEAVRNNFSLRKNENVILTGANMSGKSTFLRAIGLNIILANIGCPTFASSFSLSSIDLCTYMRINDNICQKMSYYKAEIERLRQIMAYVKLNTNTLVFLDEILKGTNSTDKENGAKIILEALCENNVTVIMSTHDIGLAESFKNKRNFENYCFEINLGDKPQSNYVIRKGISKNKNACILLNEMLETI